MLAARVATCGERLAGAYRKHLGQVRGLAASTQALHHRTALELLAFLHFDRNPAVLRTLDAPRLEAFLKSAAADRANPQHKASFLRSFVRFLAGRGEVAALRLDDIGWRAAEFRVQRPKVLAPINLPLTSEVGAALVDYRIGRRRVRMHRGSAASLLLHEALQLLLARALDRPGVHVAAGPVPRPALSFLLACLLRSRPPM